MVRKLLLAFVGLGLAAVVALNLQTIPLSIPVHAVTVM